MNNSLSLWVCTSTDGCLSLVDRLPPCWLWQFYQYTWYSETNHHVCNIVIILLTVLTVHHGFMSDDSIAVLQTATNSISCYILPSPDGHVAVGTHGCAGPSRDVFCHLDEGVLIFRVGLGNRTGWDMTLRDTCTSITLHAERWGDQTRLWTAACRRWRSDEKLYWLGNRKTYCQRVNQKVSACGITNAVCVCVYFSLRWVISPLPSLSTHPTGVTAVHSVNWLLPAQPWFHHISLCRTYTYNNNIKVYVHPVYT